MDKDGLADALIEVECQTFNLIGCLEHLEHVRSPGRSAALWESEIETGATWDEALAEAEQAPKDELRDAYVSWCATFDPARAKVAEADWMDSQTDPPPKRWTTQCTRALNHLQGVAHPVYFGTDGRALMRDGELNVSLAALREAAFVVQRYRQDVQAGSTPSLPAKRQTSNGYREVDANLVDHLAATWSLAFVLGWLENRLTHTHDTLGSDADYPSARVEGLDYHPELVVAGVEGCLDVLDGPDAERWLTEDLRPAILSFQSFYEGQAGLVFWLPSGRNRITMRGASETYHYKHRGSGEDGLHIGQLLWSGAENEIERLMNTQDSNADYDGKHWVGLHHPRIS